MPIELYRPYVVTAIASVFFVFCWAFFTPCFGQENWPMWRYDSQRSASAPNAVPEQLEVLWSVSFGERQPVWDDPLNQDLMTYDTVFEPIVMDSRMFIAFNDQDKLVALDTRTGTKLWSFLTEAPIRLPPVAWKDRVFACSDDGYLYCIHAETGRLLWRFLGGPNSQKALGNSRLTSAWPARGGPVLWEDTVYFAASIWPFMGTFIYALDAESGKVRWVNDSTGAQYIKQPHSAPSFAGVGPQGALVATEDYLIVPGGRSVPAVFRRSDGQLVHFEINAGGKGTGGSFVAADSLHFYVHTRNKGTRAFNIATGVKTAFTPNEPTIVGRLMFAADQSGNHQRIDAHWASLDDDKKRESLWSIQVPAMDDLIASGQFLIASGEGKVSVVRMPTVDGDTVAGGELTCQVDVQERIVRLLVADEKVFAVAQSGRIHALGIPRGDSPASNHTIPLVNREPSVVQELEALPEVPQHAAQFVQKLLAVGDPQGYALWFGPCNNDLLGAWIRETPFVQLAVVDTDQDRVDQARKFLDRNAAYGKVTVHLSSPQEFRAPQYIANYVFVAPELIDSASNSDLAAMYASVRPFGGCLVATSDNSSSTEFAHRIQSLGLEQAEVVRESDLIVVRRVGALPGSADWTHQNGDIANSVKSNDSRVKLPLGILWFGGNSNMDILPRHGHGPPQQVVAGRLVIQGMNSLSARDVYTGRVLWHRDFEDLGTFDVYFDATYEDTPLDPKYNQVHIPGANARGTNYVVTEDKIYLAIGNRCKILDTATGEDLGEIALPKDENGDDPEWGFIGVYQDVLLGGVGFAKYGQRLNLEFESDKLLTGSKAGFSSKSLDRAASRSLIGFDRHSGKLLWKMDARHSFWHNGIVAGGSKVYCLDRNPAMVAEALRRRGIPDPDTHRIVSLDYRTGQLLWEVTESIFGTWLGYSEKHDLLLQAGARASDRLADEVGKGMRVYNASDGSLRWAQDELAYSGPCILHNDWIITNTNAYSMSSGAFDIRTGHQRMIQNPITGQAQPWQMTRAYGCNQIIASENLLTFRSGAAGYYDLLSDSGTGNWGGFKSGCTSNLIVANGVLNAPDYTRTCSCAYQNQTSLAMVPMPDLDHWTINLTAIQAEKDADIETIGINFGAPGDRRDEDGILWMEFPSVAGDSPPLAVAFNDGVQFYNRHSSAMSAAQLPWVQASGAIGVTELRVKLRTQDPQPTEESPSPNADLEGTPVEFTDKNPSREVEAHDKKFNVELYFGLPAHLDQEAELVFNVRLQGREESKTVRLANELGSRQVSNGTNRSNYIRSGQATLPSAKTPYAVCNFEAVNLRDELVIMLEPVEGTAVLSGIRATRVHSD